MRTSRLFPILAGLAFAACSSAPKVDGKLGPGASLAGDSSFFVMTAPEGVGIRTPAGMEFLENRIAPEVARTLEAKGYARASKDGADLLVAVFVSDSGKVDAVRWGYTTVGWEFWGPWWVGGSGGAVYGYTTDYKTGTLVIDVVGAKSRKVLYRGVTSAVLGLTGVKGEMDQEQLRHIVERMLRNLPPRS
jgi:hypothetical protein